MEASKEDMKTPIPTALTSVTIFSWVPEGISGLSRSELIIDTLSALTATLKEFCIGFSKEFERTTIYIFKYKTSYANCYCGLK